MPPAHKSEICTFWMKGRCRHCNAADCGFAHGAKDLHEPNEWETIQRLINEVIRDWNEQTVAI